MSRCNVCGSYAVNDDPAAKVCDNCWRDEKIVKLEQENARLKLSCEQFNDELTTLRNANNALRDEVARQRKLVESAFSNREHASPLEYTAPKPWVDNGSSRIP